MAFGLSSSSFLLSFSFVQASSKDLPGIEVQSDYKDLNNDPRIKVKVYPHWYKNASLTWSVPEAYPYDSYNVYASYSKAGPFEKLNTQPLSSLSFVDVTTQEYSKYHEGQYFIEAFASQDESLRVRSKITSWQNVQRRWVELRAFEIQRREYFLLQKFAGVKSWLFRRKAYGPRCPRCYNTSTQAVMDDHCPVCLGTSFVDGYYLHSECWVQYEPTPNDRTNTYYGKFEPNQIGAWTISFPEITDGDVLIRIGDLNAYKVDKVSATELQTVPVRQMMVLTQVARNDVENKLLERIDDAV